MKKTQNRFNPSSLIKKISAIAITSALLSLTGCDIISSRSYYRTRPSYQSRNIYRHPFTRRNLYRKHYHKPFNNGPYGNPHRHYYRHPRNNPNLTIIIH